jgi:hypothetical protein
LHRFDGISGFPLAEIDGMSMSTASTRAGPEMKLPFDFLTRLAIIIIIIIIIYFAPEVHRKQYIKQTQTVHRQRHTKKKKKKKKSK